MSFLIEMKQIEKPIIVPEREKSPEWSNSGHSEEDKMEEKISKKQKKEKSDYVKALG